MPKERVEWTETRGDDFFMAENSQDGQWQFWEREIRELKWYKVPSNPRLLERLRAEQNKRPK
jgi:hypothetical protein